MQSETNPRTARRSVGETEPQPPVGNSTAAMTLNQYHNPNQNLLADAAEAPAQSQPQRQNCNRPLSGQPAQYPGSVPNGLRENRTTGQYPEAQGAAHFNHRTGETSQSGHFVSGHRQSNSPFPGAIRPLAGQGPVYPPQPYHPRPSEAKPARQKPAMRNLLDSDSEGEPPRVISWGKAQSTAPAQGNFHSGPHGEHMQGFQGPSAAHHNLLQPQNTNSYHRPGNINHMNAAPNVLGSSAPQHHYQQPAHVSNSAPLRPSAGPQAAQNHFQNHPNTFDDSYRATAWDPSTSRCYVYGVDDAVVPSSFANSPIVGNGTVDYTVKFDTNPCPGNANAAVVPVIGNFTSGNGLGK